MGFPTAFQHTLPPASSSSTCPSGLGHPFLSHESSGAAVIGLVAACRKLGDQHRRELCWQRGGAGEGMRGRVWGGQQPKCWSPLPVNSSQWEAETGMRSDHSHAPQAMPCTTLHTVPAPRLPPAMPPNHQAALLLHPLYSSTTAPLSPQVHLHHCILHRATWLLYLPPAPCTMRGQQCRTMSAGRL